MLEYANSDEIIADGKEICELFLIAAYCGSQSIVDKLLARCCRQETPGLFTPDDMSKALLNAAKRGHGHIVEILLAHGAKPESSIFVAAIRGGSAEVVKLLIDAGVNVDEPRGTSSLFLAVGSESIFRLLLERGADPKLCSDRMKLLTAVILTGNLAQLQELLNRVPLERITYWDESNSLMILNAALGAGRAVMEFIFDHVLQFVQQDAGRLSPVLYQAASLAHWNSFEFLLEKGVPPPNGEDLNNTINSIFLRSKIDQAEHLIDLLKCNGAKIETEGDCGTKALRNSMYNRCKPAIRFFLDRAANPVALLQSIRFERTSVFSQDSEIIPGSQVLLEASLQRLSHEERKERMKELKSEATSRQEWKTLRILQRSECQFGLFSLL
ncbi:ankyrin repeat-containing domain protein, partial [Aspergillus venezuelensis]